MRDAALAGEDAVAFGDAVEQPRDGHVDGLDPTPPPSSRARSSKSPMMRFQAQRLFGDDANVAFARGLVADDARHGEGFEVPANGGERRHQLVRDVGQQLAPHAIGPLQLAEPASSSAAIRLNADDKRGDLVAAAFRRASRGVAGAQRRGGPFERAEAPPGGRQHEEHHAERADDEQQRAGAQQRRPVGGQRRFNRAAQRQ